MAEHNEEFLRRAAQAKIRIVQISPQQARAKIAQGVTLLDVRSDAELHEGHIKVMLAGVGTHSHPQSPCLPLWL